MGSSLREVNMLKKEVELREQQIEDMRKRMRLQRIGDTFKSLGAKVLAFTEAIWNGDS